LQHEIIPAKSINMLQNVYQLICTDVTKYVYTSSLPSLLLIAAQKERTPQLLYITFNYPNQVQRIAHFSSEL
jgi:hypothetical protein